MVPTCLDYQVHLNLDNYISSRELEKVVFKHKIRILSILIADAKRTQAALKKKKRFLLVKMVEFFSSEDFDRVKEFVVTKVQKVFTNTKAKEQRKLEKLKTGRVAQLHRKAEWVENTTTTDVGEGLNCYINVRAIYNAIPVYSGELFNRTINIGLAIIVADGERGRDENGFTFFGEREEQRVMVRNIFHQRCRCY